MKENERKKKRRGKKEKRGPKRVLPETAQKIDFFTKA